MFADFVWTLSAGEFIVIPYVQGKIHISDVTYKQKEFKLMNRNVIKIEGSIAIFNNTVIFTDLCELVNLLCAFTTFSLKNRA